MISYDLAKCIGIGFDFITVRENVFQPQAIRIPDFRISIQKQQRSQHWQVEARGASTSTAYKFTRNDIPNALTGVRGSGTEASNWREFGKRDGVVAMLASEQSDTDSISI